MLEDEVHKPIRTNSHSKLNELYHDREGPRYVISLIQCPSKRYPEPNILDFV